MLSLTAALSAHAHAQTETFYSANLQTNLYGNAGAFVGDQDGDGFEDVLIGGPFGPASNLEGTLNLLSGPAAPNAGTQLGFTIGAAGQRLGFSVASVPDIDGDGLPEMLAGAPGSNVAIGVPTQGFGAMYLSTTGLAGTPDKTFSPILTVGGPIETVGWSCTTLGDTTGDGSPEVAFGSINFAVTPNGTTGRVHVFQASDALLPGFALSVLTIGAPAGTLDFGYSVLSPGDLNGDGLSEILVGAPAVNAIVPIAGSVSVFDGATGALLNTFTSTLASAGDSFGFALANLGDLDGDGNAEIAIGAPTESVAGTVRVFAAPSLLLPAPAPTFVHASTDTYGGSGLPAQAGDGFGSSIALLDDMNGDGVLDYAIGAPGARIYDPFEAPSPAISWPSAFLGSSTPGSVRIISGQTRLVLRDLHAGSGSGAYGTTGDGFGAMVAGPSNPSSSGAQAMVVGEPFAFTNDGTVRGYQGFDLGLPIADASHPLSSQGVVPTVTATGEAATAANSITVTVTGLPPFVFAQVLASDVISPSPILITQYCDSLLYLGAPRRLDVFMTDVTGTGTVTIDPSLDPSLPFSPNQRLALQVFYREVVGFCSSTADAAFTTAYAIGLY